MIEELTDEQLKNISFNDFKHKLDIGIRTRNEAKRFCKLWNEVAVTTTCHLSNGGTLFLKQIK